MTSWLPERGRRRRPAITLALWLAIGVASFRLGPGVMEDLLDLQLQALMEFKVTSMSKKEQPLFSTPGANVVVTQ